MGGVLSLIWNTTRPYMRGCQAEGIESAQGTRQNVTPQTMGLACSCRAGFDIALFGEILLQVLGK